MPGSGGWITSANAHEVDGEEPTNGTGDVEDLGSGAGTVRARDDEDKEDEAEKSDDETKWRRVDTEE